MKMNGNCDLYQNDVIPCKLLSKYHAKDEYTYVMHSAVNMDASKFVVSLSNYLVHVYDASKHLTCTAGHEKGITGVKFSTTDPLLLFSSSLDGKINIWDTRCKTTHPVQSFLDDSDNFIKPLTCFDYSHGEELVCAGTELIREDAFLLFWDRRSSKILGGYWNSHTDEISQIQFRPSFDAGMASASVDGLINVYNLNEQTESDALMHTLNVGSGINNFHWRNSDTLSCTTTIENYQLWHVSEASPTQSMSREDLSKSQQLKVDYIIDSFCVGDSWVLATGTYEGVVNLWSSDEHCLKLRLSLLKGHTDVVRTVSYNFKESVLITGGDDGLICHWKICQE